MKVKELKNFIKEYKIPDNAEVFVARIEDSYFKKHGWKTKKKRDSMFPKAPIEYIKTFSCVKFKKDKNLYIDCNY